VRDATTGFYACAWTTFAYGNESNASCVESDPSSGVDYTEGLDASSESFCYASLAAAVLVACASLVGVLKWLLLAKVQRGRPVAVSAHLLRRVASACPLALMWLSALLSFVLAIACLYVVHGVFNCRGDQHNGCQDLHHQWNCVCEKGQQAVLLLGGVGLAAAFLSLTLIARLIPACARLSRPSSFETSQFTAGPSLQQPLSLQLHIATTTAAHLVCAALSSQFLAVSCARHQGATFWDYATGEDAEAATLIELGVGLLAFYWSAIAPLGQVLLLHTLQPLKTSSTAEMDTLHLSNDQDF